MPVTYKFITPPEFDYQATKVILTFEDFHKIMELAQKQLNPPPPPQIVGQVPNVPQGGPQHVYLSFDHTNQHFHFTPGQQLANQQTQLNASFTNALSQIGQTSHILQTTEGKSLGKTPLECLSDRLSHFRSATMIFNTRSLLPKTSIAKEFHTACDNVPNVLVIIKSGQYIAGGFAAVAFEPHGIDAGKPDPSGATFIFSLNRQKVYDLKNKDKAVSGCFITGPTFGYTALRVPGNYAKCQGFDNNSFFLGAFDAWNLTRGELFGDLRFTVDEYEVFRLV